jgi:hypothetical protein
LPDEKKKKRKDLAENVLSDTEDESDGRAAASKKKFLKISFQLHFLFENYYLSILVIL